MIELTWSWFAFFMGVLATVSIGFWVLIFFAFKQWKKSKSLEGPSDAFSKMMGDWDYKSNKPNSL